MKKTVICDIDGTIADNKHRQHYMEGKKDWDGFFSEMHLDKPIYQIINKIKILKDSGNEIVFLTGRPEKYRLITENWLKKYFSFEINLLMRKDNDRRNKLEIKKELFIQNFKSSEIECCFENDLELLELWEEIGLSVEIVKNH
tara:strand:+ start:1173 stop:1601 length:429 start_codon:yes stop_codon:yes gene_type:complete